MQEPLPSLDLSHLRAAMFPAIQTALNEYLVTQAGQDLPENQHVLDEYKFEVTIPNETTVLIKATPKAGGTTNILTVGITSMGT